MRLFGKKKRQTDANNLLANFLNEMSQSPFGLWHATHRARITLGVSHSNSEPGETDGSTRWQLLAPLVIQTSFYAARETWLGKTSNREAELHTLAIMHVHATNLAIQRSRLDAEDQLLLSFAPMIEFKEEFQWDDSPIHYEIGHLMREADSTIAEMVQMPSGQAFFNQSSQLV